MVIQDALRDWLTSADAAERLSLSPARVRDLIAAGALRAHKVGGSYLVSRADVEGRAGGDHPAGRPFSARRAWALILLASGSTPAGVDPSTATKLRRALRERDLWSLRPRLSRRAERLSLRAHSDDLRRIEAEAGLVVTGARAAAEAGLDLIAPEAPLEGYVDRETVRRLVGRYRLEPSDSPNVILLVVPDEVAGWLVGPAAPAVAIALDVADDVDSRSRDAAREWLSRR